jgi:hypothetical protein
MLRDASQRERCDAPQHEGDRVFWPTGIFEIYAKFCPFPAQPLAMTILLQNDDNSPRR